MAISIDLGIWNSIFAVPTDIVDQHIRLCGAASLKVLLVILRYSQSKISLADIAKTVGLSLPDTQDALNYWIACGIVQVQPDIENIAPNPSPNLSVPDSSANMQPSPTDTTPDQTITRISSRPHLTQQDIAQMAQSDASVSTLIQESQNLLGKPLSPSATETLISLYCYGGMPVDLILMVIQYCVSIQKSSVRYIETTAYDWIDRGIDSYDKAESYIRELGKRDEQQKALKAAFGIYNRNLTSKEMEYAQKWFSVYHFDINMIKLAFERTVDQKGKISFPYCDAILKKWFEKNIKTVKDAMNEMKPAVSASPSVENASSRPAGSVPQAEKEKFDRAHTELLQRRNYARDTAAKHKEEIYNKFPQIRNIDVQLAKTGFEVSRAVLSGGNTQDLLAKLREKNLELQKQKTDFLTSAGYPADYLDPPYTCKICEDKGYKPNGEMCDCLRQLVEG